MRKYLWDTNILVHYIRQNNYWFELEATFQLKQDTINAISIISWAEIYAIALKSNWGDKRLSIVGSLEKLFPVIDIFDENIVRGYAKIDAYSQGKLQERPLPYGLSARNMGKNDIWIAATASVLQIPLLTTDADFDHLDGVFLEVKPFIL